jgi:hypothetical protein
LALEVLENRLVPAGFIPDLNHAVFALLVNGDHVGKLTVVKEDKRTGEFHGLFTDGYGLTNISVGGKVGQETTNHLYGLFFTDGLLGVPFVTGVVFGGTLSGGGTGGNVHGHDALLPGAATLTELFIDLSGQGFRNDYPVTGGDFQ